MSYLCNASVSSCFTMLLMSRPQVKKRRRARVRSSVPRNARWVVSWGSVLLPAFCASRIWFNWKGQFLAPQRQQKQRQLLGRLQDLLLGPKADEQTTCEVLDYFLRRLSSSQVASRVLAMKVKQKSWLGFVRRWGQSPRFSRVQSQHSETVSCHPSVTCLNLHTPSNVLLLPAAQKPPLFTSQVALFLR